MCQLNLYFVPKILNKDQVLKIMEDAGMDCCEYIDDYSHMSQFKDYNAYFSAPQRCNCGSIISKLQDSDYKSFDEFKTLSVDREVAELEKIRDFMQAEGYDQRKEKFETQREKLSDSMEVLSSWISKKEIELTDEIMLKKDISDEEKSRLMHETVYPVISKLLQENSQTPEFIEAQSAYQKFLSDNDLMWKSWIYTLEKTEPTVYPMTPLTLKKAIEISGYDSMDDVDEEEINGEETFMFTMPSNNIFDVIEVAKNKDYSEYLIEFQIIEKFINGILKHIDHIKLFAYWQSDDCNIEYTKTINIKDFKIEDILFLPYLTLLEIRK